MSHHGKKPAFLVLFVLLCCFGYLAREVQQVNVYTTKKKSETTTHDVNNDHDNDDDNDDEDGNYFYSSNEDENDYKNNEKNILFSSQEQTESIDDNNNNNNDINDIVIMSKTKSETTTQQTEVIFLHSNYSDYDNDDANDDDDNDDGNYYYSSNEDENDYTDNEKNILFSSKEQRESTDDDNNNDFNDIDIMSPGKVVTYYNKKINNNSTSANNRQKYDDNNITIDWSLQSYQISNVTNEVNFPVIVVGLPKTGTSSIQSFFQNANYNASHWVCPNNYYQKNKIRAQHGQEMKYCGDCVDQAIQDGLPPLKSCGNFQVYSQLDVSKKPNCHMPQIPYLQQLYQEKPTATWILNTRNIDHWYKSVSIWKLSGDGYTLDRRFVECSKISNFQNEFPTSYNESAIKQYYIDHLYRIRTFVKDHPSLSFIEIDIENPDTAYIMGEFFNIHPSKWQQRNTKEEHEKKLAQQRKSKTKLKKRKQQITQVILH